MVWTGFDELSRPLHYCRRRTLVGDRNVRLADGQGKWKGPGHDQSRRASRKLNQLLNSVGDPTLMVALFLSRSMSVYLQAGQFSTGCFSLAQEPLTWADGDLVKGKDADRISAYDRHGLPWSRSDVLLGIPGWKDDSAGALAAAGGSSPALRLVSL